jgi:hypothetical protein
METQNEKEEVIFYLSGATVMGKYVNDGSGYSGNNVIPLTECLRSWMISPLQSVISTAIDSSQSASANRESLEFS